LRGHSRWSPTRGAAQPITEWLPGPTTPGSAACRSFAIAVAALLAMLVILLGATASAVQIVSGCC